MTKIYSTSYKKLSALIEYNGKNYRIEFLGGRHTGGVFSTSDERLQDAIENSRVFKNGTVVLQSVVNEDMLHENDVKKETVYVKNINEAVNFLCEKHGCAKRNLSSWQKVREQAGELGYDIILRK